MDLFRVRLNCIDHYQSTPCKFDPLLRGDIKPSQISKEPKVPVIRVFGATETGQKVCAHIHGAFPYLYVEYHGSLIEDEVGAYIHRLHLSVDYALAVSYRRNTYDGNAKFVARITLVKGIPFYGFHVGYRFFLKIYMLNPMYMTRLADLLRQGVIMKKVFQPYEAHLQYLLQWMTDYNLYGCGYIDCSKVMFRGPVPDYGEIDNLSHLWHDRSIPDELITDVSILPRVSHCSLEVDICVQDILNRQDIKPRSLHHAFIERLNPLAPDEKLVHSMAGLWKDETRRRKAQMTNPAPGSSPFPTNVLVSMSADPRNSQPGGWIHEEEYRAKMSTLIAEEKGKSDGARISYASFVKSSPFESAVRTSLEAVEDLYPDNLRLALGLTQGSIADGVDYNLDDIAIREVDECKIIGLDETEDDFPYDSDEDMMREMENAPKKKEDLPEKEYFGPHESQQLSLYVEGDPPPRGVLDGEHLDAANIESCVASKSSAESCQTDVYPEKLAVSLEIGDRTATEPSEHYPSPLFDKGLKRTRSSDGIINEHTVDQADDQKRRRVSFVQSVSPSGFHDSRVCSSISVAPKNCNLISCPDPAQGENDFALAKIADKSIRKSHRVASRAKLSQEHLKAAEGSQTQPLGFPVVKDPHDPNTVLRLSQKNNPLTGSPKQVTLDPRIVPSVAEQSQNPRGSSPQSSISKAPKRILTMLRMMDSEYEKPGYRRCLALSVLPPSKTYVASSMCSYGLPPMIYQGAYYSNEIDAPDRVREWAGREFRLESLTVPFLPDFNPFEPDATSNAVLGETPRLLPDRSKEEIQYQIQRRNCALRSWIIADPPPTYSDVAAWGRIYPLKGKSCGDVSKAEHQKALSSTSKLSQIAGPTQKNKHGFKYTQDRECTSFQDEAQYMSTMSLEVHINTRGNLVPNPEEDEVQCLFWCLHSEQESLQNTGSTDRTHIGAVVLSDDGDIAQRIARQISIDIQEETSELDLMIRMVEIVRSYDPDILTGYEVHGGSWGYLIERARLKYDYNLCDEFSRMKAQSHGRFGKDNDKWGFNNTSTIRVTGRHMINIWRAMRSELNLLQYTIENVTFHLLHRRIPHFTWRDLTHWYTNNKPRDLAKVINHYVTRVRLDLELLEQNELIPRTSEQARLLGVDFFSVFSRGSQYKVESLMFRIAKPENFLLVSPSRKQVGGQNALECLPLVMEPQSAFYTSPLLVLDFQSLYPSVMIAYNYCYSTFLGRIINWRGTNKMGFTDYKRQQRLIELLGDHINIAPNGIMYTKPEIRKSLLAKMLGEILETRIMVKSGMQVDKDDRALQRLLNNRQLALKLIANVTYGYTSASFSGRMPCSEIADSIVQTGRETLEKAIALIHSVKRWGAEVVYGDTDSLFVYLKGRTKDQAFDIGEEIAKTVTNLNPRPVKLKFEKVYLPCVLLAKKRYVGFKYESRHQKEPDFDAKGIETVRRDGTPAEQKIVEKALKTLFRTSDLSQVKSYFQQECEKIMKGSVSVQDFCFAREVKLGTYSDKGPPPPGALISTKRMLEDARAEPQYGERVPYVVVTGAPGARLIDRCVAPEELLENEHSELDAEYYISKNLIPPLERIFNLVGANVRSWYDEMPKVQRIRRIDANIQLQGLSKDLSVNKKTLESYMKSSSCLVCKEKLDFEGSICQKCLADESTALLKLRSRLNGAERKFMDLQTICQGCSGISPLDEVRCDSKDCPVFYTRIRQKAKLKSERSAVEPVMKELAGLTVTVRLDDLGW